MRCSGRTTRIVDRLVQDYFNLGYFVASDHNIYGLPPCQERNYEIFLKVARRLDNEHNIKIFFKDIKVKAGAYVYIRMDEI